VTGRAADRGGPGRRAILFDFNGVLMDDEEYHFRAYRQVLRPLGIGLTRARYDARYLAFDDRGALRAILADAGRPASRIDALVRRKRRAFRRLCARRVRVEPETADLVRALARRVPVAVVSGAARAEILHALRGARLASAFRTIVAAEDVRRCKPDPEGYRRALRRLGLGRGTGCLAIEDSPGGIQAARAAGLEVLGIATTYAPALLRRAGAARVAPTIASLTAAEILDGRADPSSRRRSRITAPRRRA